MTEKTKVEVALIPISLEALSELLEWQVETRVRGSLEQQALIKAANAIYDFLHKDDPEEHHGN